MYKILYQPRDTTNASTPPPPPSNKPSTIIEQTPDDNSSIGGLALVWASLSVESTDDNDNDDDQRETAPARRIPRNNGRAERAAPPITTAPPPTGTVLSNSTTAVTDVNAASSTANHAQSYPTTDLPATGANTSSASSNMPDTTPVIVDLERNPALDQMILDMVSTGPTQLPIDPTVQELMGAMLQELSATYDPNDPKERNYIIGRLVVDTLTLSVVHRGVAASIRLARDMAKLSVGAKVESSISRATVQVKKITPANVATKIKNIIPAAEEAVAVTAEGIPVRVATPAEETMSFQNATQKVGGAVNQIETRCMEILHHVKNALDNLANGSKKILSIEKNAFKVQHMFFTQERAKSGMMLLGKTEEEIALKIIGLVKQADSQNLLTEGTRSVMSYLNGQAIEVRVHMRGDCLMSINAFPGHSPRNLLTAIWIIPHE